MNRPFQREDAFLADVAATCARGVARVWWLGQSGFLLHAAGRTVLFDPYLSDSLTRKYAGTDKPHVRLTERVVDPARLTRIDLVTSSHSHTDHLDAETLRPVFGANPGARLVLPRANHAFVRERLGEVGQPWSELDAGETAAVGGVTVHGIAAAHNTVERDDQGCCRFLGYVVTLGGLTVYHSGDTRWHAGLAPALRRFRIDVALVPINGDKPERRVAGNLDGAEAAQLSHDIGARLAVPHHFEMFAFNTASPAEFVAACNRLGQRCRVLGQGEGLDL